MVVIRNRGLVVTMNKVRFAHLAFYDVIEKFIQSKQHGRRPIQQSERDELAHQYVHKNILPKLTAEKVKNTSAAVCSYLTKTGGYILPILGIEVTDL